MCLNIGWASAMNSSGGTRKTTQFFRFADASTPHSSAPSPLDGFHTPLHVADTSESVWNPTLDILGPNPSKQTFEKDDDDFITQDNSPNWFQRLSVCLALDRQEVLADVKGEKNKWITLHLNHKKRRVDVYQRDNFDHQTKRRTYVSRSGVSPSSKRPNLAREKGLMMVISQPNLGLLVRRVGHQADTQRLVVKVVSTDGSVRSDMDDFDVSCKTLAFVKETDLEKKMGNQIVEPYRCSACY
ncbi:hypothetical protein PQX77_018159 [Marasmius sp. AFHP31]|nr:hypothetical protein PQX77_018159 [Marasmius sp. AFHP31]